MEYEIGAREQVSTAVVRAVSAVTGREPKALRPLDEVVDPVALDALFESRDGDVPRIGGRVEFVYGACRVTVDDGEYLTVAILDPRRIDADERYPRTSPDAGDRGGRR